MIHSRLNKKAGKEAATPGPEFPHLHRRHNGPPPPALDLNRWAVPPLLTHEQVSAWRARAEGHIQSLLDQGVVDFQDMDPGLIAQIGRGFYRVYHNFSMALCRMKGIISSTSPLVKTYGIELEEQAYAQTDRVAGLVVFNADLFGDAERLERKLAHDEHTWWLPPGCASPESVAIHEFAHIVWDWLESNPATRNQLQHFIKHYPFILGPSLSGEAALSDEELWAAGFAVHYCGDSEMQDNLYVRQQWHFLRALLGIPPPSAPDEK